MIVHPPFRWQREFHRYLLEDGNEEAAEVGTRIGVENLYPVSVAGRPVRFHRYTLAEHLEPFDHVVLDTSHFGVAEADIVHAYELLRHKAVHLHVSDNRGGGRDSHAPLGHGILPLAGFLHRVGRDAAGGHAAPAPRRSRSPSSSTAGATSTTAPRSSATCARSARSASRCSTALRPRRCSAVPTW
jgi:hypothetical protein